MEFAERSGVSLGSLKRFENTGQISFESLLRLVNVLHRLEDFDNILKINQDLKRLEKMFSK
jgi:transcriptional regulator with XRE-family HTH domain